MVDRDAEALLIHPRHHATKIHSMIGATLQDIVLRLMNHFMRQRRQNLMVLVGSISLQEDSREFDATPPAVVVSRPCEWMSRSDPTDKHTGGRGQSPAPFDAYRRQGALKIAAVKMGPDSEQRLG